MIHLIGLIRITKRDFQRLQFGCHFANGARAIHHLGHRAAAGHFPNILAEETNAEALFGNHQTLIGLFLLGHHAEQRRLAGTIRADQANFLAPLQRGRRLNEKDLPTVLLADVI